MTKLGRYIHRIGFVQELNALHGNQRICIFMQPIWAVLYNLYAPYASLYMMNLGLSDVEIGSLSSLGLFLQIFTALFGGVVIDRLGRNRATLIFDLLSWSLPCLLWGLAQGLGSFTAAALFAAFAPISANSIVSLLVEDCPKEQLLSVYAFWSATGYIAAFFTPISMMMVASLGVVPAMRILYLTMFVMITAKFISFYFLCRETTVGKRRMEESKGQPVLASFRGYGAVLSSMLRTPEIRVTLVLAILLNIAGVMSGNFFAIHITQTLGVGQEAVAAFPMVKSFLMLMVVLFVQRRLNRLSYRRVMLAGAVLYVAAYVCLLLARKEALWPLGIYIACESLGQALLFPRKDSLITVSINPEERSRILSLIHVFTVGVSMPFGTIGGLLSSAGRQLPFVAALLVYFCCVLLLTLSPVMRRGKAQQSV